MDNKQPQTQVQLEICSSVTSPPLPVLSGKQSSPSVLTRVHAGYFRITISLCCHALLWKTLGEPSDDPQALQRVAQRLPSTAFLLLWALSLIILSVLSVFYILRCFFYFSMVKAEFLDHIGVNYLFAPFMSWILLIESAPFISPKSTCYLVLWWIFALPILALDIKIYGQWLTKGKRFLSMVANPTSQISVIANLVAARAAAGMGWKEIALCLFSIGMALYLVLFVTLYQRFSGGDKLPVMLRPVFFLFIATPSMASLTWCSITGKFDTGSKMLFFLSLFLLASLVSRPILFRKSMKKYNIAWWAYSYPITVMALASAEYAQEVKGGMAHALMLVLSIVSVVITLALLLCTSLKTSSLLQDDAPSKAKATAS